MCKSQDINNCVECIFNQVILNINLDNTDDYEFDDGDHIGLVDDPNIFVYNEIELITSESNSPVLQEHPLDDNHNELDAIPGYNNVKSLFIYEPFPVLYYDMIDCELVIDSILEHIGGIFDNKK